MGLPALPEREWNLAEDVRALRNCIAHGRGMPIASRERAQRRIHEIVARGEGVRLVDRNDARSDPDDAGMLDVSDDYCTRAVEGVAALFREIFTRAGCFGSEYLTVQHS